VTALDSWRQDAVRTVECKEPDFDASGEIDASLITPRNVVYQDGRRNWSTLYQLLD
jgi:hypothetical protein